jgi:hypothetical protein
MDVFELRPDFDADENLWFHLIDRPDLLFSPLELHKTRPLLAHWIPPELVVVERLLPADVYKCMYDCYLFSARAR